MPGANGDAAAAGAVRSPQPARPTGLSFAEPQRLDLSSERCNSQATAIRSWQGK